MKEVAPLRYDVIFKKAFGNPKMFTALVSDFLDIELEIDKVESDKVFIPPIGSVATRFDLFAEDKKNRVIVEVQHVHYPDSYDRFLYYQCSAMVETVRSSNDYKFPISVMSLVFLTGKKSPTPDSNILIYDFEARNLAGNLVPNLAKRSKKHRLIFVFTNSVNENTPNKIREWMQAIDDSLDEKVNEENYANPHIGRLFELIEKDKITPEDRARMKDEYGQAQLEKKGFDKGREIGFDAGYGEGKEEGIEEGKIEAARNLKSIGSLTVEEIANAIGLSVKQVSAL